MNTKNGSENETSFLSIRNPSIWISIILAGIFFFSLIKAYGYIYWGPFAIMTWLSFFMCIGAPIILGGLFIKLQPDWDKKFSASRKSSREGA